MTSKPSSVKTIKLVLDSNVYLASISLDSHLSRFIFSKPAGINPHQIFVSPFILAEIESKLSDRKKFDLPKSQVVSYIKSILGVAELVYPTKTVELVERDPDDNKILECALEAKADMIISADKDLLTIKKFENCDIVHPSQLKYIFADLFDNV